MSRRIAIIGSTASAARHAPHLIAEGFDLVGIAPAGDENTSGALRATPAFADPAAMLSAVHPDAVLVLSSPADHAAHIGIGLDAGCHVLCSAPLVQDDELGPHKCLETARDLARRAESLGLELCALTQYAALVPTLEKLANLGLGPGGGIWSFVMRLERSGLAESVTHDGLMMELASEPLALLLGLVKGARMVDRGIEVSIEPDLCKMAFDCRAPSAVAGDAPHQCAVSVVLGRGTQDTVEIEVNGLRVACESGWADDGAELCILKVGEHEAKSPHATRLALRAFRSRMEGKRDCPIGDADDTLVTLHMLYRLRGVGAKASLASMDRSSLSYPG